MLVLLSIPLFQLVEVVDLFDSLTCHSVAWHVIKSCNKQLGNEIITSRKENRWTMHMTYLWMIFASYTNLVGDPHKVSPHIFRIISIWNVTKTNHSWFQYPDCLCCPIFDFLGLDINPVGSYANSAWKSGPVQFFIQILKDQDWDWSSQVERL